MAESLGTIALRIAAQRVGGQDKLGQLLGVAKGELATWLSGRAEPPREVFLRALERILNDLDAGGGRRPELKVLRKPEQADESH
jgi:transcriptional regulator with XRE-family HTH domain